MAKRVEYDDPSLAEARAKLKALGGMNDLHVDCIIQQRLFGYDPRVRHRRGVWGQPWFWHVDLPRMVEAGVSGACLGVHSWPWESERGWAECNRQIDYLDQVLAQDPRVRRVWRASDWGLARAEGKVGLAPGVEGAHMLAGRLERVEALSKRGVAYMTLTHFSKNAAATPSMGRGSNQREGLTAWGRGLVEALNAWGIAVDCAHVNEPGVLEACEVSRAPVFCTHTGLKGAYPHRRNLADAGLDAVARTGGAVGVMVSTQFLGPGLGATSEAAVLHIDHIVQRVGARYLAVGTDFDGWIPILRDMRDCLDWVKVLDGLLRRGYSDEDLRGMLWGNAQRVFEGVEAARTRG
jgi:membrane dipeptidase